MRLLDKQTIAQQQSNEKRLEIEEGKKLALKVDVLRETAAQEEKKLADFRMGSLTSIKNEITPLEEKRNALTREVQDLDKRREELLKPLTKEKADLDVQRETIEKDRENLTQRISHFLKEASEQEKREKAIKQEEERIENLKMLADKHAEEVLKDYETAKELVRNTKLESERVSIELENKKAELLSREMKVASEERGIINTKRLLAKRDKDQDLREKAIKDKYETLLRTINRK